ncbi:hypothetical protein [Larkinella soli]|uniref:hypothetical protein n=1 Tax=Larkinella soli TaxID=1770527 RepID=UPI000FFC289C|nr:hypothetical protein [Larkinella soli]
MKKIALAAGLLWSAFACDSRRDAENVLPEHHSSARVAAPAPTPNPSGSREETISLNARKLNIDLGSVIVYSKYIYYGDSLKVYIDGSEKSAATLKWDWGSSLYPTCETVIPNTAVKITHLEGKHTLTVRKYHNGVVQGAWAYYDVEFNDNCKSLKVI